MSMSKEEAETNKELLEDEAQGVYVAQCRKAKDRWRVLKKKKSGRGGHPQCTTCRKNDGIVKRAEYKDSYGIKSLCGGHARANGTHSVLKACIVCGAQGNWRNEEGYHCAKHAREAGIYTPQKRATCVNDNKQAQVRDPANNDALCGACATARGIKYNSCVMCPADIGSLGWTHDA